MGAGNERIETARSAELLFTDSSKNVSDLKTREWNATYYCILAIIGLAVLARGVRTGGMAPSLAVPATVLIVLILAAHLVMTSKCETNLKVFRERIKTLIDIYFSEELHERFPPDERQHDKKRFESAVVDEGRITVILYGSMLIALGWALFIIWC